MAAALQALAGDTAGGRARLEHAFRQLPDTAHSDYSEAQWLALGFLRTGDADRALSVLEHVRPQGLTIFYIMRDPGFDPIRDTPRFRALVARNRPAAP